MNVVKDIDAKHLPKLNVLVKQYNLRWSFSPYPKNPNQKDGKWTVGIDYNDATHEEARNFDLSWIRLTKDICEKERKYSFFHKTKVSIKKLFKIKGK